MARGLALVLLLACSSAALGRDLLQDPETSPPIGSACASRPPEAQPQCCFDKWKQGEADSTCPPVPGSSCSSWPEASRAQCCSVKAEVGSFDPACPIGGECGSLPPQFQADCCNGKIANDIYDISCPMGDACASWPPTHRKQCCRAKASKNETDSVCWELINCQQYDNATLFESCCAFKSAWALDNDPTCPIGDACVTYPPARQAKCCKDKLEAGKYDPICPIGDACASWPPQHRFECCLKKAAENATDGACPGAPTGDCSTWPAEDLPFCCDYKSSLGLFDALCPQPEVCTYPCADSCIISLPKVTQNGMPYFLAYTADTAKAVAHQFCQHKGYGSAGAMDPLTVPAPWQSQAPDWRAYNLATKETCVGPQCTTIGVVECVKVGKAALAKDGQGNVGCGNTGTNNIGSGNSGSNVRGNANSGSNVWGDSNSGSNVIGNGNSGSNKIANRDGPWSW